MFPARSILLACVLSPVWAWPHLPPSGPPTVNLGYASYQGVLDTAHNVTTFTGIRYAAPPTDELRWAAPQAPSKTAGVQVASTPPTACYQGTTGTSLTAPTLPQSKRSEFSESPAMKRQASPAVSESEDCLFLSLAIPGTNANLDARRKLPVVVWIHGGGYDIGDESSYNLTELVVESQGTVLAISIQYRLGLFGFLAGKEVKEGGGVLNAGLLDQEFALKWVQEHAHQFGGDPDSVTLWGQSAGAGSIIQHVVAHGGRTSPPLFRSAITSSTYLPAQPQYDSAVPQALFNEITTSANCTSSKPSKALSCLRAADASTLNLTNLEIGNAGLFGTFAFGPVVDGEYIQQSPIKLLAEGKVNGKNLLSVTNTFEGRIFVSTEPAATANITAYLKELWPSMTPAQVTQAAALYQNVSSVPLSQAIGIFGESNLICPTYWLLSAFEGRSRKGEFAIPPGVHGQDIPYYFPSFSALGIQIIPIFNSSIFAQSFAQSFLSFTVNQDPNAKINASTLTPPWALYNQGRAEMVFNATDGFAPGSNPVVMPVETSPLLLERCAFWEDVAGAV